jgi:hypothetical protein
MGKPGTHKKLVLEQRKAAKRARKEARRKSRRIADVILAVDQPGSDSGHGYDRKSFSHAPLSFQPYRDTRQQIPNSSTEIQKKKNPGPAITPPARSPGWLV